MAVTINLTPVLIALIICVFLYGMCKMARQDKANEQGRGNVVVFKGEKGEGTK